MPDESNPFRDAFAREGLFEEPPSAPKPPAPPRVKPSTLIADLFPHAPRGPVAFVIPGEPTAWSRAGVSGGRQFVKPEEREARRAIRDAARQAGVKPARGPVGLDLVASSLFPRSVWKPAEIDAVLARMARNRECCGAPKTSRPDADNLAKLVLDSIGKNERDEPLAYEDDGQVFLVRAIKVVGPRAETRCRLWYGSVPPAFPERWWEPPA